MTPVIRVVAALLNEGETATASRIWQATAAPFDVLAWSSDTSASTRRVAGYDIAQDGTGKDATVTIDGEVMTPNDLTLDELVAAGSILADIELAGLVAAADDEVSRTRLRLLLEDALFESANRAVALDRLSRLAARERRRRDDVAGLFDS